eukprot:g16768.t1
MDLDGVGRGSGGKRVASLVDKLSAGGAASEADIRTAVDEFFEPSPDEGGKQSQIMYECLSLLCGGGVVGGGKFAESDSFVERLSVRLEQDHAQQKRASAGSSAEAGKSSVQLVSNLPEETLCKLLASREATMALQGYVAEHPNTALRAFSISRLASACTRCWSFLDRRAFVNGGFEEGGDAQRYKQRVRDWMYDFFSSLPKLCEDPNDVVSTAAFSAIEALLQGHPLCVTAVDRELESFWGVEGHHQRERRSGPGWEGAGGGGTARGAFFGHKQAFPLQNIGEIVLRSALPVLRRLLHRQSRMTAAQGTPPQKSTAAVAATGAGAAAIRVCALLLVAALRLSTSPSGAEIENSLLKHPTSVDFLAIKKGVSVASSGSGPNAAAAAPGSSSPVDEEEDLDATLPPKELAEGWVGGRLRAVMEEGRSGDALLVEAAAWATLRLLQTVAMRALRASAASRVAEAFLRVLLAGLATTPKHQRPLLHAGQQEAAAGSALALRLAPPSATADLAPHILASAERVPQPRQRLALLVNVFFVLLVRPGRAGRAPSGGGRGGGVRNGRREGEGGSGGRGSGARNGSTRGAWSPGEGARLLVRVLEEEGFAQLVSDSPSSGRARRLLFREEAVAALATTCAQVLTAGVVAVMSPTAGDAAAIGVGTLAKSCKGGISTAATTSTPQGRAAEDLSEVPIGTGTANFVASLTAAAAARAEAAAEKGRWSDLETWLDCSLSALEACTRCVNWTSTVGYVGGLAYVRLLSLVLRLLCPLTAMTKDDAAASIGGGGGDGTGRLLIGGRFFCGNGGGGAVDLARALDDGSTTERRPGRLRWARQRLAQVVDDLMWRLREGLPGRDIRLRLLQATCTHVRLSAVVGGDNALTEDSANELVSVLQGELGEFDAQAGLGTHPPRAPAATGGGDDNASRAGDGNVARGGGGGGEGGGGGGGGSSSSATAAPAGGGGGYAVPPAGGAGHGLEEGGGGREHGGGGGGGHGVAAGSACGRSGSLTDVMAHEVVIGCLVRLALVVEGETAQQVLSVLEQERGRAHVREKLGRGAIGPMEEVVAKGIRAVELLVIQRPSTGPKPATEELLLKRFLGTMDLGWHAAVQLDERALTGISAGLFDHGAHAFPDLHRRLRALLCGGIGVDVATNEDRGGGRAGGPEAAAEAAAVAAAFEAYAWEEEAPQAQLNGGSDPVVVTASHIVHHGGGGGGRGVDASGEQGGAALGPTASTLAFVGGGADTAVAPGKAASRGVRIRVRVYNATNARLHGFSIRLSFGQGGEAAGMRSGGRVESPVHEVLMPSAVHTFEVPVTPLGVLGDVVVHVTIVFPDTEPEPEFESEGTAELLGVETAAKGGGAGGGDGTSPRLGQGQPSFDGGAGQGGMGVDGGSGGSVTVSLHAGSYRVPAEAFLGPPERAAATWVGFQTVWSGLPYVATFPVESSTHSARSGTAALGSGGAGVSRTAGSVRLAMLPASCESGRGGDTRAAAAVACPFGNTDYAVSTAWAFEAWDGTPVLCALTAMKAPFSSLPSGGGGAAAEGERGGEPSWHGRLEVRCGSLACLEFAQCNPTRLARFVTNGVFSAPVRAHQQEQQPDPFGGAFLPTTAATTVADGGGEFDGSYSDWFCRTDTSPPSSSPEQGGGGVVLTAADKVRPLVRALWEGRHADTAVQPAAAALPQVGGRGTVEASA